ncbi:MAG: hypothetical protein RL685_898 [Pseudomonadota bacterium]|jgi:hypothetical protein
MSFAGFSRPALDELQLLPGLDPTGYATRRELLNSGLIVPARALLEEIIARLPVPLTTSAKGSVSPLHTDLRFAPAGAPRYKDHLLLTAWHGPDKKAGPVLWIRIGSTSVGFASGVPFTPPVRERWRAAVGGAAGARLASSLEELQRRHARHDLEVAGDAVQRVPAPWSDEHPRAELLRKTGFQVRFQLPMPREVQRPAFAGWCTERWSELLPTHQWLVKHLYLEKLAR